MNFFKSATTLKNKLSKRLLDKRTTYQILLVGALLLYSLPPLHAQDWQLVWSDEFDGEVLDSSKWSYQTGTGANYGLVNWGNNELQFYTDREENLFLAEGKLHIVARAEQHVNRNYTSARIRTIDKGDWTYGKFEVRAKLPEGQGLWPAIWMMPTDNVYGGWPQSGEIDIMEALGHETNKAYGSVHYGPQWPNNQFRTGSLTLSEGTFTEDFHVFSIIWEPGRIRFFINDQLYFLVTPTHLAPHNWPFDQKFHFLLNVAVGGTWPGNPDSTTEFPQEMVVDYVRIYQDANLTSIHENSEFPNEYQLAQNYPNPFNPATQIEFSIPESGHVNLEVVNLMGQSVATLANGVMSAGNHSVSFDASELSSGVYIYRLQAGNQVITKKMTLVK
jgi:beta-glucanase (GH16 family)